MLIMFGMGFDSAQILASRLGWQDSFVLGPLGRGCLRLLGLDLIQDTPATNCRHATIHNNVLSCDMTRLIRSQPHNGVPNVLWPGNTIQWSTPSDESLIICWTGQQDFSHHSSRRDRVAPQAVLAVIAGELARERQQAALRGSIGWQSHLRLEALHTAVVDHRSTSVLDEVRQSSFAESKSALQIHIQHLVPYLLIQLMQIHTAPGWLNSHIVEQTLKAAWRNLRRGHIDSLVYSGSHIRIGPGVTVDEGKRAFTFR
mmetsp:Transcript_59330/g.111825  ORF Transcript_59330/g.111825 Transcript_59330/m.111825 type:complete len:257 (-) Transcript_59330:202-972(-)